MRTVSAMELRRRLGETLDRAAAGERIVVERDRRPLAVIVPYSEAAREQSEGDARERLERALDQLEAYGKRMSLRDPEGWSAAEVIRWERDHGHGDHG